MDELPENQLVTKLKSLKSEFQYIKNKQIIGNESVRPYRFFSEFNYDVKVTSLTFNTQAIRVTLVPDNTVQFQGLVYRMMYTITPSASFFYESSFIREKPVGTSQSWLFTFLSDPGDLYLKFYLSGASNGVMSITSV